MFEINIILQNLRTINTFRFKKKKKNNSYKNVKTVGFIELWLYVFVNSIFYKKEAERKKKVHTA